MSDNGFTKWAEGKELSDTNKINKFVETLLGKSRSFPLETNEKSKTFTVRKTLSLDTLASGEEGAKLEHLWERLLTASHPNIYNQFSLRGTNNIDMIKVGRNRTITTLYELKTGTTNDVFYAAYEITFYYFILLNAWHNDQPITDEKGNRYTLKQSGLTLIVTAPKNWFLKKGQPKENDRKIFLSRLQKAVREITQKTVTFQTLELPEKDERTMRIILSGYEKLKKDFQKIDL